MSCEIYRKIKQLENGDFLVTSKSSNTGGSPKEWVMDYFRKRYPTFTKEQREAVFILYGLYYGNKYYPSRYKKLQNLAIEYSKKLYAETGRYAYSYVTDILSRNGYEADVARCIKEGKPIKYGSFEEYHKAAEDEALFVANGFLEFIQNK